MIDWRVTQCAAHDVTFRLNIFAEADDVLVLAPAFAGGTLTVSSWDIFRGDGAPGESVLL